MSYEMLMTNQLEGISNQMLWGQWIVTDFGLFVVK